MTRAPALIVYSRRPLEWRAVLGQANTSFHPSCSLRLALRRTDQAAEYWKPGLDILPDLGYNDCVYIVYRTRDIQYTIKSPFLIPQFQRQHQRW